MRNKSFLLSSVIFFGIVSGGNAAMASVSGGPNKIPEVIQDLSNKGIQFTYTGETEGLPSYLGQMPNGEYQFFYVLNDNYVLNGVVFDKSGNNVSGSQIDAIRKRMESAQQKLSQPLITEVGSSPMMQPVKSEMAKKEDNKFEGFFEFAANEAAWFAVGKSTLPILYMIVEPGNDDVISSWNDLVPYIRKEDFQVRIILLSTNKKSEADARAILGDENPGMSWVNGNGSTKKAVEQPKPDSEQYKKGHNLLMTNKKISEKYGVKNTPVFVYITKSGEVKNITGKIKNIGDISAEIK